jgi:hypothetical protein
MEVLFCGISTCDVNTILWKSEHHHAELHYVVILTLVNAICLGLFYKAFISGSKFSNKSCPVQHKNWILIITQIFLRSLYNFTHLSFHFVFVCKFDNSTGYYDVTFQLYSTNSESFVLPDNGFVWEAEIFIIK